MDFQSSALPTELSGRKKYFYEAARDRDRTGTGVTPQDFKSCASANSATRANLALFQPLNYYTKPAEICQQLFSIFFIFPSSKPWEKEEQVSLLVLKMGGEGFEPSKLSQQIYSLPPLAARESTHSSVVIFCL